MAYDLVFLNQEYFFAMETSQLAVGYVRRRFSESKYLTKEDVEANLKHNVDHNLFLQEPNESLSKTGDSKNTEFIKMYQMWLFHSDLKEKLRDADFTESEVELLFRNPNFFPDLQNDIKFNIYEHVYKLTPDEVAAVRKYTEMLATFLNKNIRESNILSELDKDILQKIDQALLKLPGFQGVVYRSSGAFPKFHTDYVEGAIVSDPAFLSTSRNTSVFEVKKSVRFTIHSKNGRDVGGISQRENEQEILFPRDTRFKILKKDLIDNVWHVEMEEL